MKITFIYDYKDGEIWSTPLALLNEFKERGWETQIIKTNDTDLKNWVDSKPQTDIVLFMDWGRFDSQYLNKDLVPAFWIQESGDDPQNFERNSPKADRFHFTITPDKQCAEAYKKMGINSEWINHFADTVVQFPLNKEAEYVAVTSRGYGNSEFLDYLTIWGEGAIGNRNGMNAEEHTEFLNSGLMVIQNSRWKEITRRIFEGMACGKLVLTDNLPPETGLRDMFIEGEDIVYYDDMFDCIEKMNYYNENEEERERIAHNGMMKVLHNYTQVQVVDKLIKQFNNFKKQKMDGVFHNYPIVLNYFTPKSYLDVGVCKGHAIPFILKQLPSLEKIEMIEANEMHRRDLENVSREYNIPFYIEVLSDEIKEVKFYLDGKGESSTGPGNSYYLEDTHHYVDALYETRITNTLDNIYDENYSFDLIKMDTQGSELDIIKGGSKLVQRSKGIILEENKYQYNFGAPLHSEIKEYMESIGFTLVGFLDEKNRTIITQSGEEVYQSEVDTLYIKTELINIIQ